MCLCRFISIIRGLSRDPLVLRFTDERLSWVKTLPPELQILFYRWIMHYDSKIFTGKEDIQQIKQRVKIAIITPDEFAKWLIKGCPFN
ncbi:hypothetical protein DFH28DRAFT_986257 [Melampsora americana]|nr:hypothetical protein DFH28DRAFT_986257 [Melampsora americana]